MTPLNPLSSIVVLPCAIMIMWVSVKLIVIIMCNILCMMYACMNVYVPNVIAMGVCYLICD